MRVSISEIGGFLSCRTQWDWGSPNRRNLTKSGTTPGALWLGTGIHFALENWYRLGMNSLEDVFPDPATIFHEWAKAQPISERPPDVEKLHTLGYTMLTGYTERYGEHPMQDVDGWVPLTTEQEWPVPIPGTDGILVGTVDGLIRDADGGVWVIDHKTYTNKPREDMLVINQQFLAYTYAMQRLSNGGMLRSLGVAQGTPILGTLWNGLRKQMPGPNVKLPVFAREWVSHNEQTLALFEQRLITIYKEMANPRLTIYPTPADHCGWCAFNQPCIAQQLGEDAEWYLNTLYQPGKPRGKVYEGEGDSEWP